jgi:MFS family permease
MMARRARIRRREEEIVIASLSKRLPFFYGWIIVAVCFVTMALGVNARTAFSLLFPPILAEFGWDRGTTAGAFSFGFLVSAVLSPMLGRLMDRRGPRVVMELGVLAMGAGLLLATLSREPWHIYATLGVLVGAGSVCLGFTGQTLFLPSWFVRRRGLALSLAFSGVGVGSIILLPWLQTIIEEAGWRAACRTLGILVLVVLAPLNLLLRRRPEQLGLLPDGDGTPAAMAAPARRSNIVDPVWAATDWTLARAMRTTKFWWLATGYSGAMYMWYAVQVHQTKYLVEIGFSSSDAAWALGAVSLVGIPGQIALGQLSDRVGRELVWAIGCFGFALTYGALLLLQDDPIRPLLYVMVLAQGLLGYGLTPVFGAVTAELFEGRHYGAIFGTVMLAAIGGGAVGPWLTGLLHDWSGSYALPFEVALAVSLLSAVTVWRAAPGKVRAVAGHQHRADAVRERA